MAEPTKTAQPTDEADLDLSFYEDVAAEEEPAGADQTDADKTKEGEKKDDAKSNDTAAAAGSAEQGKAKADDTSAPVDKADSQSAAGDGVTKTPQSAKENAEFARRRREAEQAEKIAAAAEEARINAIIEAVGENPYTKKPIKDAEDVDQYLLMKKIEKDGGDPIEDFPEYSKKQKAERAAAEKAAADADAGKVASAQKDVSDFKAKYPAVDLQTLAKDADFDVFSAGKLGNIPLTEIYEQFQTFKSRFATNTQKAQEQAAVSKKAKENAAVGSLASTDDVAANALYSLEQLKAMSEDEIEANWDKVLKSKAALKI